MKPGRHHARAVAIFDGPAGSEPRFREGIIREIERALDDAYPAGRDEGALEARRRAITEAHSILTGFAQSARALDGTLVQELNEIEALQKKTIGR